MIGIGKRIGNNKLQFTEGDAYAASQGATLVNPVCEQVQRNKLRGIALNAAIGFVNAAIASALEDGATVLLTVDEIVDQLPSNYAEASFLYIPFARKAGVSYALKGPNLIIDRNSNATEVNRSLLLAQAGLNVPRIEFFQDENLEPWSEDFTQWTLGAGASASLAVITSAAGFAFTQNLLAEGRVGGAYATSDFTPDANSTYTYTAFFQGSGADFVMTSGGSVSKTTVDLGGGVFFVRVVEQTGATPTALQVGTSATSGSNYIVGVQARKGSLLNVLPSSYIKTVGEAIELTLPKGHVVEPQLTNYILYSSSDDNWDKRPLSNPVIVTQNSTIAPDGSSTGLSLSNFTNPGLNIVNNSVVWIPSNGVSDPLDGTKYFGLWIKSQVGNEQITLVVRGSSNGTNPLINHLIDITEEWNYYQVSTTFSAANGGSGLIGIITNVGTKPASFYVWGAQLSETPGTLVSTNGAVATRLSENATATLAAALQSYMIVIRFRLVSAPVADSALIDKTTSGQDAAGRIRIDTQGRLYYTSTATGSLSLMSALSSAENVYVLRVNEGLVDQFINGAKGATSGTNASDVASALKIVGGANIQVLQCSVVGVENDAWCLENSQP